MEPLKGVARRDCFQVAKKSATRTGRAQKQGQSSFLRANHRRNTVLCAVSRADVDELEMRIRMVLQEMDVAAKEEEYEKAIQLRTRLDELSLKQRCLEVELTESQRASVCYRIGQVIRHKKYTYRGLIFGVHCSCKATDTWIESMGVDRLPLGRDQPFYQVLVDERSRRGGMVTYVAQENITIVEETELEKDGVECIQHNLRPTMFSGFNKTILRYTPYSHLVEKYPDSLEAQEEGEQA